MARKAFLFGVNTSRLQYAEVDVQLMQECLRNHDYEVLISQINRKPDVIEQFDNFLDEVGSTDTVVFYYSGHAYLLKGALQLVLDDLGKRGSNIEIDFFTRALDGCRARHKFVILDCCHSGAAAQEWKPEPSDNYRILAASDRLEKSKELDELQSSFLTYYIHKGLIEDFQELVAREQGINRGHNILSINTFYEWLKSKASQHKSSESLEIPIPSLYGNQKRNFPIATIHLAPPIPSSHQPLRNGINLAQPCHNLPHKDYSRFVGRDTKLRRLLECISPGYRQHVTTIGGIGGVGKTALVIEAAYECWKARQGEPSLDAPLFDAIIYTSAKKTYLTPEGILERPQVEETLLEIFKKIAFTLGDTVITRAPTNEQQDLVYQRLSQQRTLLIVDNVETLSDGEKQRVLDFLANLPNSTQAVLTTRERVVLHQSVYLESLSREESFQLIEQQVEGKEIDNLSPRSQKQIYNRFGGIPVALIYAIGQRKRGYSLKKILDRSRGLPRDVARFCFEGSVAPLRGQPAHKLLMALSIFQAPPLSTALASVSLVKDLLAIDEGLAKLDQLSLVRQEQQGGRYTMLPITREYALAEFEQAHEFEHQAREQWVQWYTEFAQRHGGEDWQDWRIKYDRLGEEWENFSSVLFWCAAQGRYDEVKTIWQSIDNYVDLGGYWRSRRHWWRWLEKESKRRVDLSTHVKALLERGWTLTLLGGEHQKEAAQLLANAWRLRRHSDLEVQTQLAGNIAMHRLTKAKYQKALQWLDRAVQCLEIRVASQPSLNERSRSRSKIRIAFYQAEIYYRQASYAHARERFEWVVAEGENIGWQRFVNYAQNRLAEIAIQQQELEKAEDLLERGLRVAEASKEKRRIALYQAAYAKLEAAQGNKDKARRWAEEALKVFSYKIMADEVNEMEALLASL